MTSKGFNPMETMMHKMMGQTEGDGANLMMKMMMEKMAGEGHNPMETMMGKMADESFKPMEMFKQMLETVSTTAKMAIFATPEVQALFEDWVQEVEKEVVNILSKNGQMTPAFVAKELNISEESALYFVTKLIRAKKIRVTGLEVV